MNNNYDLELTAKGSYKGNYYEIYFDPYNDCTDMDGLKDLIVQEIIDSGDFEEPIEEDEVDFEIIGFNNVPEKYATEKDIWEFAEAFAECEQEIEVIEAALECGVSARNIDEAYAGQYKSNEDFAQETAFSLGAVDENAKWPMNCIDWDQAANELMQDYSEYKGYYFRDL